MAINISTSPACPEQPQKLPRCSRPLLNSPNNVPPARLVVCRQRPFSQLRLLLHPWPVPRNVYRRRPATVSLPFESGTVPCATTSLLAGTVPTFASAHSARKVATASSQRNFLTCIPGFRQPEAHCFCSVRSSARPYIHTTPRCDHIHRKNDLFSSGVTATALPHRPCDPLRTAENLRTRLPRDPSGSCPLHMRKRHPIGGVPTVVAPPLLTFISPVTSRNPLSTPRDTIRSIASHPPAMETPPPLAPSVVTCASGSGGVPYVMSAGMHIHIAIGHRQSIRGPKIVMHLSALPPPESAVFPTNVASSRQRPHSPQLFP